MTVRLHGLGHGIPGHYHIRNVFLRLLGEFIMATDVSIEQRLAAVEKELAALKARLENGVPAPKGVEAFIGTFKDDPEYEEIVRLGRQFREADQPQENDEP